MMSPSALGLIRAIRSAESEERGRRLRPGMRRILCAARLTTHGVEVSHRQGWEARLISTPYRNQAATNGLTDWDHRRGAQCYCKRTDGFQTMVRVFCPWS